MSELQVVASITGEPGSAGIVAGALSVLAGASRAGAGRSAYELFESAANLGTFVPKGSWATRAEPAIHPLNPIPAG